MSIYIYTLPCASLLEIFCKSHHITMDRFQLFPSPPHGKPESPILLEEIKGGSSTTEAVLLRIIQDTKAIKQPPRARIARPATPGASRAKQSSKQQQSEPVSTSSSRGEPVADPLSLPSRPVRLDSLLSGHPGHSPARSSSGNARLGASQRKPALRIPPVPEIDAALGPKTAPASIAEFPSELHDAEDVRFSSSADLVDLWAAANGQQGKWSGTFSLRMTR